MDHKQNQIPLLSENSNIIEAKNDPNSFINRQKISELNHPGALPSSSRKKQDAALNVIQDPSVNVNIEKRFSKNFSLESERIKEFKSFAIDLLKSYSGGCFSIKKSCSEKLSRSIEEIYSGDGASVVFIIFECILENEVNGSKYLNPEMFRSLIDSKINQYSEEKNSELNLELSEIEQSKIKEGRFLRHYINGKMEKKIGFCKRTCDFLFGGGYKSVIRKIQKDLKNRITKEIELRRFSDPKYIIGMTNIYTPSVYNSSMDSPLSSNYLNRTEFLSEKFERSPLQTTSLQYDPNSKSFTLDNNKVSLGEQPKVEIMAREGRTQQGVISGKINLMNRSTLNQIPNKEDVRNDPEGSVSFSFIRKASHSESNNSHVLNANNLQDSIKEGEDLLSQAGFTQVRQITSKLETSSFIKSKVGADHSQNRNTATPDDEELFREMITDAFTTLKENWPKWEKFTLVYENISEVKFGSNDDKLNYLKELGQFRGFLEFFQNILLKTDMSFTQWIRDISSETNNTQLKDSDKNSSVAYDMRAKVELLERIIPKMKMISKYYSLINLYSENAASLDKIIKTEKESPNNIKIELDPQSQEEK